MFLSLSAVSILKMIANVNCCDMFHSKCVVLVILKCDLKFYRKCCRLVFFKLGGLGVFLKLTELIRRQSSNVGCAILPFKRNTEVLKRSRREVLKLQQAA